METNTFDFRIINLLDGTQIIDRHLETPYDALTPSQMVEYMQIDAQLSLMDRLERKKRAEAEHRRKIARNPFYRFACMCGLV